MGFSIGIAVKDYYVHQDPKVNIDLYVKHNSVSLSEPLTTHESVGNLITDIGEGFIRDAMLTLDSNSSNWAISLSNDGSPAAGWTELTTEIAANGFTRAAGDSVTWTNSGDAAFNVTYTFTATDTQQLQTAGLQWDDTPSSNNNLFAAADFTQTTFNAADTLTITWVITVDAN